MSDNSKEVFVKTQNIREKNETEKIKEKLQTQRDKRLLVDKFRNTKSLVDSEDEEDATEWYIRMQQKDAVKELSRKRAHRQEDLQTDQERLDSKRRRDASYSSKDLKGFAIGHNADSIKDGAHVILTLRDKDVLNDNEDVLENINLLDDEKAAKNVDNKVKKPDYKPYDDDEFDEFGILKKSSLLSKYDEEIEGPKKDMFRIGESSSRSDTVNLKLKEQRDLGKIALSLPEFKVASEYYTAEEMVKFKKPKRKGALRKRNVNVEPKEEIKPIEPEASNHNDHGSRSKRQDKGKKDSKSSSDGSKSKSKIQLDLSKIKDEVDLDVIGPDQDLTGIRIEEDEAEKELFSALNKTRKLKLMEKRDNIDPALNIARIVEQERSIKMENDNDDSNGAWDASNLVLDTTAEYCRNLGDIPKYENISLPTRMDEEEEDDQMDMQEDMAADSGEDDESDTKYRNNWNEVDIKMEEEAEDSDQQDNYRAHSPTEYESKPILEEEPDVSVGVAGALKLAMNKGYLDKESNKPVGANRASSSISAQAYTIEEKF